MDSASILHNAARHYCMDRDFQWRNHYARLDTEHRARKKFPDGSWTYTDEAFDTIARGQVMSAILHEIERFVATDFRSIEECRDLLMVAGETAQSPITKATSPVQVAAIRDERARFIEFVKTAELGGLSELPALPFRRVLGVAEHQQLHTALRAKWGKWYGGCVDSPDSGPDTVTLHVAAMEVNGSYDCVRRALSDRGIRRLFELREYDDGYEMETEAAEFTYNGAEGFWTSTGMEWMVYASHESSITFGGSWLITAMRQCLPEFERYLYRGWDLSIYQVVDG